MKKIILWYLLSTVWLLSEQNATNALKNETSPYLQQHIHNPVNWYPWGKEALDKAKKENKLIFLSIGYSTCHWCHVMEEESFVDEELAKLLNDDFIAIKVDREEYPQIDKKYQQHYIDVHGKRGGWPLSVFMSPRAEVFFLGTYIPKEEGYGSKGLLHMLPSFVKLQKDRKAFTETLIKYKKKQNNTKLTSKLDSKIIENTVKEIAKQYDFVNGGFATRPKFPEASKIELLLAIYALNGNKQAFTMAETTLRRMAEGGIYDQIGGGFFRYTTDYAWQIPHFEKMLYTNAELITVYVKLYQMTGDKLYKRVVDETIAQMEKHYMQDGLYLSASDADSDGEEGGYFIYEYEAVEDALQAKGWKPKEIEQSLVYLGIEEDGNIDGDLSHTHITSQIKPSRVDELRAYLKQQSAKRTFPFVDKKINTAWASMMIKALFVASKINDNYLALATQRLENLLTLMRSKVALYHQVLLSKIPTQKALLEDYTFLIDALIVGYGRSYNEKYLSLAETLVEEALAKFYRDKRWYLSDDGIGALADFDDRYYTSALSQMLENLVRLSTFNEDLKYNEIVKETIHNLGSILEKSPAEASKLVQTFLRLEKGDIVIHASREKLLLAQTALNKVGYPFLLSKTQESDEYLACKTTMCFAYDKNISKLIEKINHAVKPMARKIKWNKVK